MNAKTGELHVVAFMNRKGGVGKTTLAVSTAQGLARAGYQVLFMDFDTQQHGSAALLDMEADEREPGVYFPPIHPDYNPDDEDEGDTGGRSSTADLFYGVGIDPYPTHFENLDVVPATRSLRDVEQVRREEVKERIYDHLARFFAEPDLNDLYDVVVIDTPPTENILNRSILRACTHVVVPFQPEEKAVSGIYSFFRLMADESKHRRTPIKIVGLVPNLYRRSNLHESYLEQLRGDPAIAQYLSPHVVGNRITIPTLDLKGVSPNTLWDCPAKDKARQELIKVIEFIQERLYG